MQVADSSCTFVFCQMKNLIGQTLFSRYEGMWKYLHPQYQDISHEVQECSAKLGENMLKKAAHFQGRGKHVLLQMFVTADLNSKKCFGDDLSLWKILHDCLRNMQNPRSCTNRRNKLESGFALKAQKSHAAHERQELPCLQVSV